MRLGGEVVTLSDAEAMANAHKIEPYPLAPEIIASRFVDKTRREYVVRAGFAVHAGEKIYEAGAVLTMSDAEIAPHLAQVELLANVAPPASPAAEDMLTNL